MAGHGEKKSRKREAAIAALLSEPTLEAAAQKAGIAPRTLRYWLDDPGFLREFRDARRAVVEGALARLQQAAGEAVDTLRRNLTCGEAGPEIRAALGILDQATKAIQLTDLVAQLEELRALVEGKKHDGGSDDPDGGPAPGGRPPERPAPKPGPGPPEGGAGERDGASGDDGGPVAAEALILDFPQDAAAGL